MYSRNNLPTPPANPTDAFPIKIGRWARVPVVKTKNFCLSNFFLVKEIWKKLKSLLRWDIFIWSLTSLCKTVFFWTLHRQNFQNQKIFAFKLIQELYGHVLSKKDFHGFFHDPVDVSSVAEIRPPLALLPPAEGGWRSKIHRKKKLSLKKTNFFFW